MFRSTLIGLGTIFVLLGMTVNGQASVCPAFPASSPLPVNVMRVSVDKLGIVAKHTDPSGKITLTDRLKLVLNGAEGIYLSFEGGSVGDVEVTSIPSRGCPARPPFTISTPKIPGSSVIDIPIFSKCVDEFHLRSKTDEGFLLFACPIE